MNAEPKTCGSEELRRAMRQVAMRHMPPGHADEAVDLALHAVDRAFEAAESVLQAASRPEIQQCATGITLSVIGAQAVERLERLKQDAIARMAAAKTGEGAHG